MSKIAVIGSNMVDLITYIDRMPAQGETLEAPGFALGCGGKGANQAVAAAKLGADVLMLTKVGDDMFADNTLANFQRFGIDTRYVQRVPGVSSGVAPIFVQADSHNSILIVKGANAHLVPADIDGAAQALRECSLIVLQLEINVDTVYHAIEFGRAHNIPVLLNPAPALPGLSREHLAHLDFLVPNESELALITGQVVDSPASAHKAAQTLVADGIRHVIVTLGQQGALYVGEEGEFQIPGLSVAARDTTGAGDAFIGCFIHHWSRDRDIRAAMTQAVAYSACSVTGLGTQTSYPDATVFAEFQRQPGA
ncbi:MULTISPECIES: ribokinase [unclassified Pseudomonas]|uniref:ribokinase n=1 Tax=unclassified Pseudomonas TaxID=196821 RepID=UPI000C869F40|nr:MULTISPECIES: ribokinase [unclassified Pseudomonas]PMV82566.1 ribokinase [Pseudomonas sp. GW101-1A09]PMV91339.1 ribokinase [Pseudomonas sp. FW306-2-2C-B10A]PMW00517.1 ribokinase [Pseudomonas sp. GW460-C8]PMW02281.1 ribokinase [Pseudomonas sp. MPR-TSA4]PMW05599.1 ribokinase [Pseudomonas sp. FW306-2-1A-C05A]